MATASAEPPGMTAESAQRSATIADVVAVRGGGIQLDASLAHAWILVPEYVDGRRFVDIYTAENRCRGYLNGRFAMVEKLKRLRDAKAAELMRLAAEDGDPNDSNTHQGDKLTRPKRELIDKIPKIIEVEVATRNGVEATVSVLPSWRERQVLQIELSRENLDLLLEEPQTAVSAPFTPNIQQPDVFWVNGRNSVRCTYWCKKSQGWKTKSQVIEFDDSLDENQKQEVVSRAAELMQLFFNNNHSTPPGNGSAGSAHGEPSRKKARTDASDETSVCEQQPAE